MSPSIRTLAFACLAAAAVTTVSVSFTAPALAAPIAQAGAMSDANIIAMVMAINDSEIGAANAALTEKDVSGDTKDFAQKMVKDHTANNADLHKIADKAGMKPEENEEIKAMKLKNADALKQLKMLDKDAFAKGYIDMNVTAHTEALAQLDKAIAAAQNADLKEHLNDTREHVQHHLDEAKKIQADGAK